MADARLEFHLLVVLSAFLSDVNDPGGSEAFNEC